MTPKTVGKEVKRSASKSIQAKKSKSNFWVWTPTSLSMFFSSSKRIFKTMSQRFFSLSLLLAFSFLQTLKVHHQENIFLQERTSTTRGRKDSFEGDRRRCIRDDD